MNRLPRWSVWSGLTVAVWLLWFVWLYGNLSNGADAAQQLRDGSHKKLTALQARVAAVPDLAIRLDSVLLSLESTFDQFHSADQLDLLMDDLKADARRAGVLTAVTSPDLKSILKLDVSSSGAPDEFHCDTLLVELSATSDFLRIGRWLDAIERRADFQHWVECRWSDAGSNQSVHFEGLASLLVTRPRPSGMASMESDNGR